MSDTIDVQQAYNAWAAQCDHNKNNTRDLEALALRATLKDIPFKKVLEAGCGTGKNTVWLAENAEHVTAVDLSDEMLAMAKQKLQSEKVDFIQADILQLWHFAKPTYDLVTLSLVLEHIEHLEPIFKNVSEALSYNGICYVSELHPFKQYTGTKARFDTAEGRKVVDCYNHNISDFVSAADKAGLKLIHLDEQFDNNDRTTIPRILTLLFKK